MASTESNATYDKHLFNHVRQHFHALRHVDFNQPKLVRYYLNKYPDLSELKTPKLLAKHWEQNGKHEGRNPLNHWTIRNDKQLSELQHALNCIIDAYENKLSDLNTIPRKHFLPLIFEISNGIHPIQTILDNYTEINLSAALVCKVQSPPKSSKITELKNKYLCSIFQTDNLIINHLLQRFTYETIYRTASDCHLIAPEYFKLLQHISRGDESHWELIYQWVQMKKLDYDTHFYLEMYPVYKKLLQTSQEQLSHYQTRGLIEKLIPNQTIFNLIAETQHIKLNLELAQLPSSLALMPILTQEVYILTRTHQRQQLFMECLKSVQGQIGFNPIHIISVDDLETKKYVNLTTALNTSMNINTKIVDLIKQTSHLHPNQYIDKLYEALTTPPITNSSNSWVLVLDDDDRLTTPWAFHTLREHLNNPKVNLITWKFWRPDKFIYPLDPKSPKLGEIASCAYMYRTDVLFNPEGQLRCQGIWGASGIGDYTFYEWLCQNTMTESRVYVDLPLTGVNYTNQVSGWSAN
jgi:hypothetical protein